MSENLVIVESPAKAKTIEKFLGKDYLVKSSFGHVRDLPKKELGIDVEGNFRPTYEVSEDKKQVVSELRRLVKAAKRVWLASDEDREGEAIAWHLAEVLGLDVKNTRRIVFHEITKNAILQAIESPRTVNIDLVNAQQARRILDRLVGFELSPVLWKKVRPALSAGRVQSVAVRLVVEREREIIGFKAGTFFRVTGLFLFRDAAGGLHPVKAELPRRFPTEEEARAFLETCRGADFTVARVEKKPGRRTPAAPFTTSTLQQEAGRKLGFSVSRTMSVAQRLYEAGLITYMRTDSVNLSAEAIRAISGVICGHYGKDYLHNRAYKTKSKGAQEAHEAIRPSYIDKRTVTGTYQEQRLYDLIWKRTVASQMADAQLERTTVDISVSGSEHRFVAKGEVIAFDGFLRLYAESTDDDNAPDREGDEALLPPLKAGDPLERREITATQRFDQRPPRYSEASLVKHLEELGIGRPSTYAPTISTIINRGYVVKEDREGVRRGYTQLSLDDGGVKKQLLTETTGAERAKLFPTDIGMVVNDYLESHFPSILDYNFTARVEKDFDDIAEGKTDWQTMLRKFYAPFHSTVTSAEDETVRAASTARLLGRDPATGKNVYARMGKFGAMAQIGETEDEDGGKPRYASLQPGQLIASITLEEALRLFSLPRTVGTYEEKEVVIGLGRFGPYVRHDGKFVSLGKTDDPLSVSLERAVELIELKRKQEREKVLRTFPEDDKLQVLNGRWGPYLHYDGTNVKLPKTLDPAAATYAELMAVVKEQAGDGKSAARSAASKGRKAAPSSARRTTARKTAGTRSGRGTGAKTTRTAKKSE